MRLSLFNETAKTRILTGARFCIREGAVLLVIACVLELIVRTAAPEYLNNASDGEVTGGHPRAVNPDRYRGPRVEPEKAPDERRVLCLGDSVTYGTGVAADATWASQVQKNLQEQSPDRQWTAINAGVPASSVPELTVAYRDKWLRYEPDHVVLAATSNMVALSWIRRDSKPELREAGIPRPPASTKERIKVEVSRMVHRVALPRFLKLNVERMMYRIGLSDHRVDPAAPYGPMLAHGIRQEDLDPAVVDDAWAIFERDMAELDTAIRASGRKLVVVYVPTRFMAFDGIWDNEKAVDRDNLTVDPAKRLGTFCKAAGIDYIDATAPLNAFRQARASEGLRAPAMYINYDFTHLSDEGHAAVAQAVVQRLTDR